MFLLATPYIAGPGAMTTMVLLHAQAEGTSRRIAAVEAALAAAVAGTFVALVLACQVSRLLGGIGANVVGHVLMCCSPLWRRRWCPMAFGRACGWASALCLIEQHYRPD
jgi:hypothetical protein